MSRLTDARAAYRAQHSHKRAEAAQWVREQMAPYAREVEDAVVELYVSGVRVADILREYDTKSANTIYDILRKHNVYPSKIGQ